MAGWAEISWVDLRVVYTLVLHGFSLVRLRSLTVAARFFADGFLRTVFAERFFADRFLRIGFFANGFLPIALAARPSGTGAAGAGLAGPLRGRLGGGELFHEMV